MSSSSTDGHIPGPAARRLTQEKPLFQHRRQETFLGDAVDEVAEPVVAHDDVRVSFAASGVVAVNVKGLHAKDTRNIRARHLETQTVTHGCAKQLRRQATVRSIQVGRNCCDPCSGVLRQQPCEPLVLNRRRRPCNKACVNRLVKCERGLRLRAPMEVGLGRPSPRLTGGGL